MSSKDYIVLFYTNYAPALTYLANHTFVNLSLDSVTEFDTTLKAYVNECFIFDIKHSNISPSRLFLRALAKYGKYITIQGSTRKLFKEVISSSLSINQGSKMIFGDSLRPGSLLIPVMSVETLGRSSSIYRYIHVIDPNEIASDVKRMNIL